MQRQPAAKTKVIHKPRETTVSSKFAETPQNLIFVYHAFLKEEKHVHNSQSLKDALAADPYKKALVDFVLRLTWLSVDACQLSADNESLAIPTRMLETECVYAYLLKHQCTIEYEGKFNVYYRLTMKNIETLMRLEAENNKADNCESLIDRYRKFHVMTQSQTHAFHYLFDKGKYYGYTMKSIVNLNIEPATPLVELDLLNAPQDVLRYLNFCRLVQFFEERQFYFSMELEYGNIGLLSHHVPHRYFLPFMPPNMELIDHSNTPFMIPFCHLDKVSIQQINQFKILADSIIYSAHTAMIFRTKFAALFKRHPVSTSADVDHVKLLFQPKTAAVLSPLFEQLKITYDESKFRYDNMVATVNTATLAKFLKENHAPLLKNIAACEAICVHMDQQSETHSIAFWAMLYEANIMIESPYRYCEYLQLSATQRKHIDDLISGKQNKKPKRKEKVVTPVPVSDLPEKIKEFKNIFGDYYPHDTVWTEMHETIFINKTRPYILGLLACLDIPALTLQAVQEPAVLIRHEDLAKMPLDDIKLIKSRLLALITKVEIIDNMVCRIRHKTKTRLMEHGIKFRYLNENMQYHFEYVINELILVKTLDNEQRLISYRDLCAEHITTDKLAAARDRLTARLQPAEPIVVEKQEIQRPARLESYYSAPAPQKLVPVSKTKKSNKKKTKKPAAVPASSAPKKPAPEKVSHIPPQPENRGKLPPRDYHDVPAVALESVNESQLTIVTAKPVTLPTTKLAAVRAKPRNAHEGAIQFELENLQLGCLWMTNARIDKGVFEEYSLSHHYSTWFAIVRLLNAIHLRKKAEPACLDITENDLAVKKPRAAVAHNVIDLTLILVIRNKLLEDKALLANIQHALTGKKARELTSLTMLSQFVPEKQIDVQPLITQTFDDLAKLVAFYEKHLEKISAIVNTHVATPFNLFSKGMDFFGFEARAIQACIVRLGELYKRFAPIRHEYPDELNDFLHRCREIRNRCLHVNADTQDYQPVTLQAAYQLAKEGCKLMIRNRSDISVIL